MLQQGLAPPHHLKRRSIRAACLRLLDLPICLCIIASGRHAVQCFATGTCRMLPCATLALRVALAMFSVCLVGGGAFGAGSCGRTSATATCGTLPVAQGDGSRGQNLMGILWVAGVWGSPVSCGAVRCSRPSSRWKTYINHLGRYVPRRPRNRPNRWTSALKPRVLPGWPLVPWPGAPDLTASRNRWSEAVPQDTDPPGETPVVPPSQRHACGLWARIGGFAPWVPNWTSRPCGFAPTTRRHGGTFIRPVRAIRGYISNVIAHAQVPDLRGTPPPVNRTPRGPHPLGLRYG